ncbi:hypothetical protein B0H17DRAFT_1183983 [Mycena rosella]|uniref:Uncharacterized protein n=1 Tax=Mycena rosella TaxID=1033263 RepID=A0AAD7CXV6_MYCRO|nr:hypothetical protein B0H17DRAFT_1183983 [Mycena rosella]
MALSKKKECRWEEKESTLDCCPNPLDLTMGSCQDEETPLDTSIASEINPSAPIQGEGVTEEAIGGPLADILQELLVLLPTRFVGDRGPTQPLFDSTYRSEDGVTSEDSPPSLLDSEFSNDLTGERNSLTEAPVLFTDPVEDVLPTDMNATIGAPSSPGNTPQIVYFIGVVFAPGNATVFCVPGPTVHPSSPRAGGIIDYLVVQNGPAGRTLECLSPCSAFRVGISRVPEDIVHDFMSFRTGFVEVGHLDDVCAAPADSARVHPARDCDARTAVLASLGLDNSTLMFVFYVYPEDTNPLSIVSVHSAGVLLIAASMPSAMTDAMRGYLELHYASCHEQLTALLNTPGYQLAYEHCPIEWEIMSVCNGLGIIFSACQIMAAEVEFQRSTVSIRPDDIANWMNISATHFATCRTEVTAARATHLLLRQLAQHEAQGRSVQPPMELRHHTLLRTLSSMMSSRILLPVDLNSGYMGVGDLQAGDANAVCMKVSSLKAQVAEVKALWAAQYQ